jgi:hypothetical protein
LSTHQLVSESFEQQSKQHLVPKPNASVYLFVDVVAGPELLFVAPTANAPALQGIVKPPGKSFVRVVIADETRIELNRLREQQ